MTLTSTLLWQPLTAALLAAAVAFVVGVAVGLFKGQSGWALLRGLEAGALLLVGTFLTRLVIAFLLSRAPHPERAAFVLGWAFLLWPGIIDTIPALLGHRWLTTPEHLLTLATLVGGGVGFMNGLWGIHGWAGILTFPLNVTWGLAGNTTGLLLHLVNVAWGQHSGETRTEAHRYASGFRLKGTYGFTQGCVMSNTSKSLSGHEFVHVVQNLVAGPYYVLSYVAWMVLLFVPGMIAGLLSKRGGLADGIEGYTYDSNPWEAVAYASGGSHSPKISLGPVWTVVLGVALVGVFVWLSWKVIPWGWQ
ncbi:hypothetical protein HNQ07_002225 [Deinococcus metalli]|uniref:Uncharacterized protein n=1 Tax=Deinococcus metalli TaxID=1141878 RepID=A0A7W8NPG3_9DEIO|nr:hypothetical protein [Deinococcus metalli]MBB5376761.1 hypothetical protein [Deinococcus metalli]GHF45162.1 hypothetical protein GCM10017781_21900 [Deinococcus metalli]